MKKILIVSLALLLFGSFGCESVKDIKAVKNLKSFFKAKPKEQELQGPEKFFWDSEHEPIAIAPIKTVPPSIDGPSATEKPFAFEPEPVVVSEPTTSVVSMTYPWPECGIVQLDKIMPTEVELNRTFDYIIKVTNLTDTMLTGIVITEELPDNFKFMSANPAVEEDSNKLVWQINSLGPQASKQMIVSGAATYMEPLEHRTTVITPVIPSRAIAKVVQPRLELTRTAPAEVLLCDPIPVIFVVTNSGTGSARNVKIIDTLPAGLRTIDGKSKLVFDVGTLTESQSRQFSIELRAIKTGRHVSTAVASSSTGLTSESATTTTTVNLPVLTITNVGPKKQYLDRTLTYEITVANTSDALAKNTVIEDSIPEGVTLIDTSAGAKISDSKIIWEVGTLIPHSSRKVRVSYLPTKAGTLTNIATATAYCSEVVTASVETQVTGISAVSLEVVDLDDPVRVGGRATYLINVTNQGSAAATNVRITCILENNIRYISSSGATVCSTERQMVKFLPLSNLAPKAKADWRVVVEAVKPGDVRFKVVMNTDQLTRPVEEAEATHIYE